MSYKPLKVESYNRDGVPIDVKYKTRFNGEATIHLGVTPNLMKNGERSHNKYQAFIVYTRELQNLVEMVTRKSDIIKQFAMQLPDLAYTQYYGACFYPKSMTPIPSKMLKPPLMNWDTR